MTAAYHATGLLQAALFLLSISAVYVQLRFVWQRRHLAVGAAGPEPATYNLSSIAAAGSFFAFFSFLLLSTATEPFAHYIFWTRIPACILAILLLWEFRRDDPSGARALLGPGTAVMFIAGLLWTVLAPGSSRALIDRLQLFVLAAGVVLVSGQTHQLALLLKRRRVGALSLKARTLNLLKDLSTVAFGITLGAHQSWSLMAVAGANALVTSLVLAAGARFSERSAGSASPL